MHVHTGAQHFRPSMAVCYEVETGLGFLVSFRDAASQEALPCIRHGASHTVIAVPGNEYDVCVQVHANALPGRGQYLEVGLRIDDNGIGYSRPFNSGSKYYYEGFLVSSSYGGSSGSTLKRFRFASTPPAGPGTAEVQRLEDIKIGKVVFKAYITEPTSQERHGAYHGSSAELAASSTQGARLPEGKKFFMAPSCKSTPGATTRVQWSLNKNVHRTVSTVGEFTVKYDTAATLVLRKVLDPNKPEHARIISKYGPAAQQEQQQQEQQQQEQQQQEQQQQEQQPAGAAGNQRQRQGRSPSQARGAAGGRTVKRERARASPPASSATSPARPASQPLLIDLTGEGGPAAAPPLRVRGRVLDPREEFAECDLTGRSQRWQVHKKPKLEVD